MATKGVAFSAKDGKRIAKVVKQVEAGAPSDLTPDGFDNAYQREIWAKLTDIAASDDPTIFHFAWIQQREILDGFEDMPGGLSGTTTVNYALDDSQTFDPTRVVRMLLGKRWDSTAKVWVRTFRVTNIPQFVFFARYSNPQPIAGEAARWTYTLTEVGWTTTGRSQILTGGRVVTGTNFLEDDNPTSGEGDMPFGSVDSDEFAVGIDIQPSQGGGTVKVYQVRDCTGTIIYKFSAPNIKNDCGS